MPDIKIDESQGIAVFRPDQSRGLSVKDFDNLNREINNYLEMHKHLNGLVIVSNKFPGWQDWESFISHIKFVRDHHKLIGRVAMVGDGPIMSNGPLLADHFVRANGAFSAEQVGAGQVLGRYN